MPIRIISNKTVVFDSLVDTTYEGGALIQNTLNIVSELDAASQCTFQVDPLMTKIIDRGNIIEVYYSEDDVEYVNSLIFYGRVVKIIEEDSASTITCLGFISILSISMMLLDDTSNLDGYMCDAALAYLFENSPFYIWMRANNYPLAINITQSDNIYLVNTTREDKSPIRTEGYGKSIEVMKSILDTMYHYTEDDEYPLYYHLYEQNKSIMLMREKSRNEKDCILTLTRGSAPLVANTLKFENVLDKDKNCWVINGKDYDNEVISYTSTVNPNSGPPIYGVETNNALRSSASLKKYAEMMEKYSTENHYRISCKIEGGETIFPGDYIWINTSKFVGPALVRKVTKEIGSTTLVLGEKEPDFASIVNLS